MTSCRELHGQLTDSVTALKYHPDRNPGQEAEFNAKFQAISAANEVLGDATLRAKYDAQRLKEGPSKGAADPGIRPPNVPPRNRASNFPPPPRAPPYNPQKHTFSPPTSAGIPRKYDKPPRPNSASWGPFESEEVKSKANDFKAWEQMRHGQGPIPRPRPPPRSTKTAAHGNEHTSPPRKEPDGLSSKARRRWEDLLDAGMQNFGKYSGRPPPKKSGYDHDALNEDELQGNPSAYNVFKGDHPRRTTDMPPPPPHRTKKPEPVPNPVREPHPPNHLRHRVPPYHAGVERSGAPSPGLQRATTNATPRDAKNRANWANTDSYHLEGDHIRATSAGAAHRAEAFRAAGISSTTTSETTSSASSDEADAEFVFGKAPTDRARKIPKSRKPRMPAGASVRMKTGFSPHVRVDEGQAPHPGYSDLRRHSGIDLPTQSTFAQQSESLHPHRMSHGAGARSPNLTADHSSAGRFPQRHRSFDGRYQSPPATDGFRPPSTNAGARTSMFDQAGYSPLSSLHYSGPLPSERWSRLWPFGPLKQEQYRKSERPPCWAIPSSLPPVSRQTPFRLHNDLKSFPDNGLRMPANANTFFNSFKSMADNTKSYTPPPPLRSQSSETINTKFFAGGSPPKFGVENPFAARRSSRHDSDSTAVPPESQAQSEPQLQGRDDQTTAANIPPPPKVGDRWSPEDWEKRFGPHTFEIPGSNASSRAASRKRSGTPKTASLNNLKRAGTFRSNGYQSSVIDDDESPDPQEMPAKEFTNATEDPRTSNISDGNAMDIDSTPPAAQNHNIEHPISPTSKAQNAPIGEPGVGVKPKTSGSSMSASRSQKMDMSGFRHVAPFASEGDGLGGIEDLKSALPFESRSSPTKPDFAKCYEKPDLPKPPRAPSPPGELNDLSFNQYVSAMNHYMFNWNNFSTKILMLFQRRQEEHREIGQGWIGQVGGHVDAYLIAIDEDERGRQWWSTACERHKETMQNLKSVREKMLKAKESF